MNYLDEPKIVFRGNDLFDRQAGGKVCLDYSKRTVRMSLVLRKERQRPTLRRGLISPKEERKVCFFSFDDDSLEWPEESES